MPSRTFGFENKLRFVKKVFLKAFSVGLVSGAVLTLGVIASLLMYQSKKTEREFRERVEHLPPLQFPEVAALSRDEQADPNWTFWSVDGAETKLAQFHGKVVLLHFWATWCAPCVKELPSIEKLQSKLAGQPVAFVLVSSEDRKVVKQFLQMKKSSLPSYVTQNSAPASVAFELPTTLILSPDGFVAYRHSGMADWDDPSCISFILKLSRPIAGR
jgi:thiol-disulfide isomerase/thioredoxin